MADGQTLSLRDELQAASDALTREDPVIEGAATLVAETPAPEAAAVPEAPTEPTEASGERARGPDGKFLPKEPGQTEEGATAQPPVQAATEPAAPAVTEPQSEAIRVPPSLPAAVKAKFAKLDPDVRDAFVSLEGSVQTAKAEWAAKGQRLNRFDEIIGPRLSRWQMAGVDEFQGVQMLLAAQDILDRDPVQGLVQVARSYGVTPAHLAQAFGLSQTSAQAPAADGLNPTTAMPDLSGVLQQHLAPVLQQVQTLQQQLSQSQHAEQATKLATAQREIDAFAADPANMYFDNVQDAVVAIIAQDRQNGGSMPLKEAYDRAVWADPNVRPHLIQAQQETAAQEVARKASEAQAAAQKAAQAKAQAARNAGGSVTGSPSPGASAPAGAPRPLREELQANWQAQQGV
jgi:hypothetical protein